MLDMLPIPFASAHRAGNSRAEALKAIANGADLLETDIWFRRGRIEIRHDRRLGPLPILWAKWSLSPAWAHTYDLRQLLHDIPPDVMPFLDFKGNDPGLGPAVLAQLRDVDPTRVIGICGRNHAMLESIAGDPQIICFYSVATEEEWMSAQPLIEASSHPALSLLASMATPERINWMKNLGGVVVCWGVEDIQQMDTLRTMGVDGFTTDHVHLMKQIRAIRDNGSHLA